MQLSRDFGHEPKLAPQIHSVNVSSLGSALATVTNVNTSQTSTRPKHTLSNSIQIGHNRTNSTKVSVAEHPGKLDAKPAKAQDTYQDYSKF